MTQTETSLVSAWRDLVDRHARATRPPGRAGRRAVVIGPGGGGVPRVGGGRAGAGRADAEGAETRPPLTGASGARAGWPPPTIPRAARAAGGSAGTGPVAPEAG